MPSSVSLQLVSLFVAENVLRKCFISPDERGSDLWENSGEIQIKVIRYFPNTKHPDIVWKQFLKHSRGRWATPEASGVSDLPQLQALVAQSHQNAFSPRHSYLMAGKWEWSCSCTPRSPARSQSCTLKSRPRLSSRSYPVFVRLNGAKTKLGGDQSLLSHHLHHIVNNGRTGLRVMAVQLPVLAWLRCCHRS